MTLAQVNYPNFNKFNQEVFDGIKKEYSKASWIELSEELRTTFNSDEVGAIKRLFYGYKPNFSLEELRSHVDSACCEYNNVRDLLNKHELVTLLSTLYRVGYIGNVIKVGYKSRYSFCYRGDDDIMLENFITIHRGLRPYLSTL
jgi:hypothetical protein